MEGMVGERDAVEGAEGMVKETAWAKEEGTASLSGAGSVRVALG